MIPVPAVDGAAPRGGEAGRRIERVILRLVKGGPERRAIEAGEADAILDQASGRAFLLPAAQRWLLDQRAESPHQARDRRPDRAARNSFEDLATEIGVLDAHGVVLSANAAWRDAAARGCLGAGLAEGESYLAACDGAAGMDRLDGLAIAAGVRQVIAGERKQFRYEHSCRLAGRRSWFQLDVTRASGDPAARAVVSREDISGRKSGELLLGLEYDVARVLAEASDARAALRGTIRAMCEALAWDCGRYFRLDPEASVLRFHEGWGVPTPAVGQFLERSHGVVLRLDAGLKGRVYRTGQPLWVVPGTAHSGMAPAALPPETDGDGAFIFPVTRENRTTGVLAFSGRNIHEPDDRMLQAARAIGSQLGGFLHRQQSLDTLRQSEARFRRLTALSTDWYWQQDRDFRFTEYAGAGVLPADAVLGKTLWELPNVVAASADWAAHREQLGERWSFCDFEFTVLRADGQPGYYCISGEPIFDEAGAFTGYWGTGLDITRRKRAELALRERAAPLP